MFPVDSAIYIVSGQLVRYHASSTRCMFGPMADSRLSRERACQLGVLSTKTCLKPLRSCIIVLFVVVISYREKMNVVYKPLTLFPSRLYIVALSASFDKMFLRFPPST